MNPSELDLLKPSMPKDKKDILLLVFLMAGIAGLLTRGGYVFVTSILQSQGSYSDTMVSSILDGTAMFFCAACLAHLLIATTGKIKNKEDGTQTVSKVSKWWVIGLVVAWLAAITVAFFLHINSVLTLIAAVPSFLVGISVPILVIFLAANKGIQGSSRRSIWASLAYGMVGGTFGAMLLEGLAAGGFLLVAAVWADTIPGLGNLVEKIHFHLSSSGATDIQSLLPLLAPLLKKPAVIVSILIFASVLTPIIEETLKPAILWVMGKKLTSPVQGFVLGAACGAGFAALEGFLSASNAPEVLGFGIVGRAAASWMHITSSAILGWGIASFKLERKTNRLIVTWLAAIAIHGVWNGSAILAVIGAASNVLLGQPASVTDMVLMVVGGMSLASEFVLILFALPILNHQLGKRLTLSSSQIVSDIIAPLDTKN